GSAAFVSISNLALLPNPLGVANGRYTGNSGYAGSTKGTNIITDFDFGATPVTFTITDFHSATTATTINLPSSYAAGGMTSLVDAINTQIVANNLLVRAFNNNGTLELRSLESGVESNFTVVDNLNTLARLFINTQTTNSGYDGVEARQDFAYDQSSAKWGYNIGDSTASAGLDHMSFYIADLDGRGMVITITEGVAALGQSFRTIQSIANIINQEASTAGVKVAAEIITANMSMKIYSTVPGKTGRVTFAELASPDSVNTLNSIFGITPKTYDNGVGQYSYTMHLKDAFIQLQIGPNEGHSAKANIVRTDIVALGIRDLDLTTVRSSQEAIGLVDKALQYISSERAKLGAIENRLTYTTNSLRVGLENMSASESRIRDVDVAREVVELTRFQILQQSSNAMLAQANTSAQRVLDLLR
ncbi:MAG TPA: flagellin, partial [Candidatus Ozemobacteraceae bacterium]|nr:flagellin [Candidatus Ozemobacteraceae bacterium]